MVVQQMGKITWVAIGIYILMLIVQMGVSSASFPIRNNALSSLDARVKLMNEILTGIRVI